MILPKSHAILLLIVYNRERRERGCCALIVENEFFNLFIQENQVVIHTIKKGYPLKSFDLITREYPRLRINSFTTLRTALIEVDTDYIIGTWLPLVEVTVSSDKMKAEIIANATIDQLTNNRQSIINEARELLNKMRIIFGYQNLNEALWAPGVPVIGAIGREPIPGADAVATYIEIPERKPAIREDGSADHYEMNFVFPISEGEWLGEKTFPGEGQNGSDVFGNELKAIDGNDIILRYDKKAVYEEAEEGRVVMRALHGGALEFLDGLVTIGQHLTISGDVGVETGSITFDGSVSIRGTIQAGYSVIATGDISVEGKEGITNAKIIQSSSGDVYIKGGVFGGNQTIIEAQGNVFIKHGNDCKLYGKEIHTGLYLFGVDVVAEEVYLDKNRGRIIGGTIEALYSIECAIVGNNHERTTKLLAKGVDKNEVYKLVQVLAIDLKKHQAILERLEKHTSKLSAVVDNLSFAQKEAYEKTMKTIDQTKEQILKLDAEIQYDLRKMNKAKPASIKVVKEAFPGTIIQIGRVSSTLHQKTNGVFKLDNGVLNV